MRTITTKLTTITAALALALGATFTLSGCFGNPIEGLVKDGIGGVIKEATGAEVDLGGKAVPADFPALITVVDGEVQSGGTVAVDGRKIWTVRLKVSDPNVFEEIQAGLRDAGFEETVSADGMGMYEGHGLGVAVNVDDHKGDIGVTYVVTELKGGE
jgi:hypothetical protein